MNSNNILKKYFPKHLRNNLPFSKEDCLLSLNRITKDLSCDWIDSFSDRILGKIKQVQSSDIICFQDILYIGIMLEKIKSEINDSEYRKIVKKL